MQSRQAMRLRNFSWLEPSFLTLRPSRVERAGLNVVNRYRDRGTRFRKRWFPNLGIATRMAPQGTSSGANFDRRARDPTPAQRALYFSWAASST
jgi:hypothetical protein